MKKANTIKRMYALLFMLGLGTITLHPYTLLANKYYVLTLNNNVLCSGCSLPSFGNFYGYSLYSAINDANNHPGLDTIYFNKLLSGSSNLNTAFVGLVNNPSIPAAVASATPYSAGSSPYTIYIDNNGYPDITDPVLIDAEFGFSGGGCGGTPRIQVNNTSGGGGTPFRFKAGSTGSTIRGFSISGFATGISCSVSNSHTIINNYLFLNSGFGIIFSDASNCTVLGNKIGFKTDGTAGGNGQFGILFDYNCSSCHNNTIGGNNPCDRNYISNNGTAGVALTRSGISIQGTGLGKMMNARVINNFIGTDLTGTVDMGNGENGIVATWCDGCTIENNLISGNQDHGVIVQFGQNNGVLRNNIIGTDPSGTIPIGNTNFGINVEGGTDFLIGNNQIKQNGLSGIFFQNNSTNVNVFGNTISNNNTTGAAGNAGIYIKGGSTKIQIGNTASEKNIISGNKNAGIEIDGSGSPTTLQNPIRQNSIFCNQGTGKGIVLINNGNNNYAAPTIVSLAGTTLTGTAPPNSIVEIFYDNSCPYCQGKDFIMSTTATAGGNWSATHAAFTTTTNLTATATEPGGGNNRNTSRFSVCSSVLPIDIIHFEGTFIAENTVKLVWNTNSKQGNVHFIVERSYDMVSWSSIGVINENERSGPTLQNEFIDYEVNQSTYYRLIQLESDGEMFYSKSILLSPFLHEPTIILFPNPANTNVTVGISTPNELTDYTLSMLDLQGRIVFETEQKCTTTFARIDIPLLYIPVGFYIIKINSNQFEKQERLIVSE